MLSPLRQNRPRWSASIVVTGATPPELAEVWAWVNSEEALVGKRRHLPAGTGASLVDLLSADEEEWEE